MNHHIINFWGLLKAALLKMSYLGMYPRTSCNPTSTTVGCIPRGSCQHLNSTELLKNMISIWMLICRRISIHTSCHNTWLTQGMPVLLPTKNGWSKMGTTWFRNGLHHCFWGKMLMNIDLQGSMIGWIEQLNHPFPVTIHACVPHNSGLYLGIPLLFCDAMSRIQLNSNFDLWL